MKNIKYNQLICINIYIYIFLRYSKRDAFGKVIPKYHRRHYHHHNHHRHHRDGSSHHGHHHHGGHHHNGGHHHGGHHHEKNQYRSKKPHTATIIEETETEEKQKKAGAAIIENIEMVEMQVNRPNKNKYKTKMTSNGEPTYETVIDINESIKSKDAIIDIDKPNNEDSNYLPTLPINDNDQPSLYSDDPVIDRSARTLSQRDVEDMLDAPRARIRSNSTATSSSSSSSSSKSSIDIAPNIIEINSPWGYSRDPEGEEPMTRKHSD